MRSSRRRLIASAVLVGLAFAANACEPADSAYDARRHYKGPDGLEWFETNCGSSMSDCRSDAGSFCRDAGYLVGDITDDGNVVAAPMFNGAVVAKQHHDYTMAFRCRQPGEQGKK